MIRNTAGTILLAATVTAAALTQATYVRAASKYDGNWSVVVYTRSGPCDPAYRFSGQIVNGADDAVPTTHNPNIRAALAATDKEYVEIAGATHYYVGQPDQLSQCIATVTDWSRRKNLLAG